LRRRMIEDMTIRKLAPRLSDAGPGVRGTTFMGPASETLHNCRSHAIILLVDTAEHLAAMVIPAARLAAILLQIARGLPSA
jgi:hypothetical protein